MIGAHARWADAAERQLFLADMEDHVVHRHATGDRPVEQLAPLGPVASEIIERERPVAPVHFADRVLDAGIAAHRQHRPEDLLLHHDHVVGRVADDVQRQLAGIGAGEILVRRVHRDHLGSLGPGIVDPAGEALIMPVVDHCGIVRVRQQGGIHARGCRDEALHHRGFLLLGHQHVIGREADLPRIEHLAQRHALGRLRDVRRAPHHDGRLAAQLQRHRREVVGGGMQDVPRDAGRAGEQQMVERHFGERLARLRPARDEGQLRGIEIAPRQLRHQRRDHRRIFAGLHHRAIARREDAGERAHHQLHRKVPRRDDPHHPLGLIFDAPAPAQQPQREQHRPARGLRPVGHPLQCMLQWPYRRGDVGDHRLVPAAMAEILAQGIAQLPGIVRDHRDCAPQSVAARVERYRQLGHEGCALGVEQVAHAHRAIS